MFLDFDDFLPTIENWKSKEDLKSDLVYNEEKNLLEETIEGDIILCSLLSWFAIYSQFILFVCSTLFFVAIHISLEPTIFPGGKDLASRTMVAKT